VEFVPYPFSTFPYIPRKASFWKKRFIIVALDTTPKLPISIPLAHSFPRKIGKRPNSIPIYILEVKSALNSSKQEQFVFISISAHSPAFREKLLSG
jgi:hypothetical protein